MNGLLSGRQGGTDGSDLLCGDGLDSEIFAETGASLGGQFEKIIFVASDRGFGDGFTVGSVLQPDVEADAVMFFAWKGGVRPGDNEIGTGIFVEALESLAGEGWFFLDGEFAFGTCEILLGDEAKCAIGGEFGANHFSEGVGEPIVFFALGKIAKT